MTSDPQAFATRPLPHDPAMYSSDDILQARRSIDRMQHRVLVQGETLYVSSDTFTKITNRNGRPNAPTVTLHSAQAGYIQNSFLHPQHATTVTPTTAPIPSRDRPTFRAMEVSTGEIMQGSVSRTFTGQELVDAVQNQAAYIARTEPLVSSAAFNFIDSSQTVLPQCWVIDLQDYWRAPVVVPDHHVEPHDAGRTINRSWYPPEGLVRIALNDNTVMTYFGV